MALPLLKTALGANPKTEQFWMSYIDALIKETQFEEAKQILDQAKQQGVLAQKLNVLEEALFNNRGVIAKELDDWEFACSQFREALKINPNSAEAYTNLGNTLHELGRLDEAEASCRRAIDLKPNLPDAHNNLGLTLKALGRLDEAEAGYNQAIALRPDFAEAYNNLGLCLLYTSDAADE